MLYWVTMFMCQGWNQKDSYGTQSNNASATDKMTFSDLELTPTSNLRSLSNAYGILRRPAKEVLTVVSDLEHSSDSFQTRGNAVPM